jgi:ATP-binding cassette subfamily B protein
VLRNRLRRVARTAGLALRADPAAVALAALVTAVAGLVPVATALAAKAFVDGVVAGAAPARLAAVGAGYGLVLAAGAAAPDAQAYLATRLARGMGFTVSRRLYEAVNADPGLQRLERPEYQDRVDLAGQAGDLAPEQLVTAVLGTAASVVSAAGLAGVLLSVQPAVALLALAGTLPLVVAERRLVRRRVANREALTPVHRRRAFYRSLLVQPQAAKEIRLFGLGGFFAGRMLADLGSANRAELRLQRHTLRVRALLALVDGLLVAGCLAIVAARAGEGLTAGEVAAFLAALLGITTALGGIVTQSMLLGEGYLLLDRVHDLLDEHGAARRALPTRPAPPLTGEIRVEEVWFRYADDLPWVLRGVDLVIPAGGSVALVGLNGSGKSTLVKLLCRLYEPTRGRITWDGVDLAAIDPASLRARIGAVFQDFMAYDLTAQDNVGVGDLDRRADRDAVRAAADAAGIGPEIEALPRGYDTMLSRVLFWDALAPDPAEPAVVLSGGQWQRLALARMFLRGERDLVILDEPSSGLDAEAEAAVHAAVARRLTGRARLLVSHRLAAVRTADSICVLHGGRVAERGRHEELLARRGRYARLFTLQASGYRDAPADPAPAPCRPDGVRVG